MLTCLVNPASAGLITIGALTSNDDGSTTVITDTLNNLEWLRWNELADKTYAETLAFSVSAGWTIAGVFEANLFLDALYNNASHGCDNNDTTYIYCLDNNPSAMFTSAQYTSLLGDSSERGAASVDAAWFYDDVITDSKVGFLNLTSGTKNEKYNNFADTTGLISTDTYAHTSNQSIGWLMFRTATVPEPSTLALFSLAVIAMAGRQFNSRHK